jgi:hypothetical protein
MGKFIDLTGQKFGRLTARKFYERKNNITYWMCDCECGNKDVIASVPNLRRGTKKSCGCIGNGRFLDLTGKIFGKLTVLKRVEKPAHLNADATYYLCRCECTKERVVCAGNLLSGTQISCGCTRKEYGREYINQQLEKFIGKVFGRLTVKELFGRDKSGNYLWKCSCNCGKYKIASSNNLISGNTRSCGCLDIETRESRKKKYGEAAFNVLFGNYKREAKARKIIFNLSKEEFLNLVTKNCCYCNCEPKQIIENKFGNGDFIYNGIDRIDSSLGYTIDNVVTACGQCNQSKKDYSQDDFYSWNERVYFYQQSKKIEDFCI